MMRWLAQIDKVNVGRIQPLPCVCIARALGLYSLLNYFPFIYCVFVYVVCVCMCMDNMCMLRSQHTFWESALFFHHGAPEDQQCLFPPSLPFFLPLPSFFSSLTLFICPDFFLSFLQSYKKYLQEKRLTMITECVVETTCSLQSQLFAFGYRLKAIIVIVLEDLSRMFE